MSDAGSQPRRVGRLNRQRNPPSPALSLRDGDPSTQAVMAWNVGRGTKEWLRCVPALFNKSGLAWQQEYVI